MSDIKVTIAVEITDGGSATERTATFSTTRERIACGNPRFHADEIGKLAGPALDGILKAVEGRYGRPARLI